MGGGKSEGCIGATTSGNLGAGTRPSKGGPCRYEPCEGNMEGAKTSEKMSTGLTRVVERARQHAALTRRISMAQTPEPADADDLGALRPDAPGVVASSGQGLH
jgi:hypothetical protein